MQSEIESLDAGIEIIETQRAELQHQLEGLHQQIREQRQQIKQYHEELHTRRSEMQSVKGKITSLELLQQHAMGKDNKHLSAWLESVDLTENRRLAEFLEVQSGWDTAVETVLGSYLEAICIESADQIIPGLQRLTDESLTLVETKAVGANSFALSKEGANEFAPTNLLDKVKAPWDLSNLLAGVYCADDAETARTLSAQLKVA